MEVLLLGTGAADGIPNPFCRCATCTDARERGDVRTPTSVLVDGRLLIDPGPEAPRQVTRFGRDLTGLEVVLAGHAHSDHLDPALLMHRGWVTAAPLRMLGPAPVVGWSRQWLADDQSAITFTTLTAGDEVDVSGYRVSVLAANHEALGEACLYRIQDARSSLLYATDTGLLPAATLAALAGRPTDLVLLEETFGPRTDKGERHLHFGTFAATVEQLRGIGVIHHRTRVVAIHLAHDNPPLAELTVRLAALGAEVLPDGAVLNLP